MNDSKKRLLIVDDDQATAHMIATRFGAFGYDTVCEHSGSRAIAAASGERFDLILLDLIMPEMNGIEVLTALRAAEVHTPAIIITAAGSIQSAVAAMQAGAADYATKPIDFQRLKVSVERAIERYELEREVGQLRRLVHDTYSFPGVVARSAAMQSVVKQAEIVATSNVPVLLTGESGTGKEVIARAIHVNGNRRNLPFVAINCAAIPRDLTESELFGHEKGSFTGAAAARRGRFEEAGGGTIFLDEIGELELGLQAKLLRVLQEREFVRVGGSKAQPLEARVICATNRNLEHEIQAGRFREDLYYRINVFRIELPPLRERPDDIPELARRLIERFNTAEDRNVTGVTQEALDALMRYAWPGNVRELENTLYRAGLVSRDDHINLFSLPAHIRRVPEETNNAAASGITRGNMIATAAKTTAAAVPSTLAHDYADVDMPAPLAAVSNSRTPIALPPDPTAPPLEPFSSRMNEAETMRRVLAAAQGNWSLAARKLKIGRTTLYRKARKYGLLREAEAAQSQM